MYHQHQTPMPFHSLSFFFFFFFSINLSLSSIRAELDSLNQRSSLSVESSEDVVVSPDGSFSAGFRSVGDNAFCFAVWFTKSSEFTPVWMANRDRPVNGKRSTLSLQKDGNLVLRDAGQSAIWTTNTASTLPVQLRLSTEGNLMLQTLENTTLWQSFDFPTNTLLPEQLFTRNTKLISSRSRSNYSSGFYSFYFDNDNLLRLLYNGPNVSSVYWPDPGFVSWDNGRNADNSSRFAMLDLLGFFQSTDEFTFYASDYGIGPKRRLTMDFDGNLRLYSLDGKSGNWRISWQAMSNVCQIHGLCGPNGVCVYEPEARCTCPHGFKPKDPTDWSQGCEPTFSLSCDPLDSTFVTLLHMDFYGNDFNYTTNITIQQCRNICLELCSCKAFVYKIESLVKEGSGRCYPKTALFSGYRAVSYDGWMNIKVPRNWAQDKSHDLVQELNSTKINCNPDSHMELATRFERKKENVFLRHLLWFVTALGGVELICLVTGWWYTYKNKGPSSVEQGYITSATGYKRYSYAELKRATRNFSAEIGRGGSGVVYRGRLVDNRVVAVKRLEGVHQGEAEFLAEVSMIGRINHMNLIKMWGLCADKCHDWEQRLLVFEYMENGSLAENLSSNALDWGKRFGIAVGTAKGLAYLHEECLEWVLHCDVKPQNILLDANYLPKVADFGLSKLRDRGSSVDNSSFSTVRGTRGYMAPEWILNLPITSKVDVYSYGIVVLEMVTGKLSIGFSMVDESRGREYGSLVIWVREMMNATADGIEEIMDPRVDDKYDEVKMRLLVKVALQCVEEDKDARPTMSQVAEMLLRHEHKH